MEDLEITNKWAKHFKSTKNDWKENMEQQYINDRKGVL